MAERLIKLREGIKSAAVIYKYTAAMLQVTQENFMQIVDEAFNSHDQSTRELNHRALEKFMGKEGDAFVELCAKEFQNVEQTVNLRLTVSTLFKGGIAPNEDSGISSIWPNLSSEAKSMAKKVGLLLLVDVNDLIKKAAASLVSKVFAMDWLTDKTWTDLISNITMNLKTDNPEIKKAAMMTLGYICEDLNQFKITDLPDEQVEFLLGGICMGLETYDELTNTSISALANAVNFLAARLQKENVSDYIFNLLVNILVNAKKGHHLDTIINVLNLLGELCRLIYYNIDKYYQVIINQVLECYKLDVVIQVNEFFCTLVSCEQSKEKGVFDDNWSLIVKEALDVLLALDPEEDDEAGLSKHQSILLLLTSVNSLVVNKSFSNIMEFIAYYIEQPDDKSKIAALIAFESLIETAPSEDIYSHIDSGFDGFLGFLTNSSMNLKIHSARVLSKIARDQTEVFLQPHNFAKAHELFSKLMVDSSDLNEIVSIKKWVCNSYEQLADNYPKYPEAKTEPLRAATDEIVKVLVASIQAHNEITYMDIVFSSIFTYIKNVFNTKQLNGSLATFFAYLSDVRNNYPGQNKKQALELIFVNLSIIVARLHSEKRQLDNFTSNDLLEMYDYVVDIFDKFNEILSEGLLFLANLICVQVETFRPLVDSFMKIYIVAALRDANNTELFKSGVDSISILTKNVNQDLAGFIKDILPYLVENLENPLLKKELRIPIFFAIADCCLYYHQIAVDQIARIISVLELGLEAVLHLQQSDDPELLDYGDALKEVLLDCYLCIIHGVYYNIDHVERLLESRFRNLIDFIKLTSASELNPTIEYLRSCLGCLIDIFSKNLNYSLVERELVQNIYDVLKRFDNITAVEETLRYTEEKYFANL